MMNSIQLFVSCMLWLTAVSGEQHETATERIEYPMESYGLNRDCGLRTKDYIVGDNSLRKYPWLVKLLYSDLTVNNCGGVLITEEFVLTTKDCIESNYLESVLVGEYNASWPKDWIKSNIEFVDTAQRIFIYYKKGHALSNIALLNLKRSVRLSVYVHPICLPWCKKVLKTKNGIISGWGYYSRKNKTASQSALHTHVMRLIPGDDCLLDHGWQVDEFCAEGRTEEDECRGMQGGPFMMVEKVGKLERYVVVGLQIAEPGVCGILAPMAFVNVTYHMDWILDNLDYIRH